MKLIRASIDRPIAVMSVVLMTVLFGFLALTTIPIQLTPDINSPVISVRTEWPGAAPAEVEREVTNRQEDVFAGLPGLTHLDSNSSRGFSRVTLEFDRSTNMDKALLLVANRLDRISGYPSETREPTISMTGSEDRPIAWFVVTREPGNTTPVHQYGDFLEDVVKDRMERVHGVSEVEVRGGSPRQIQVVVRPDLLASYRLTVSDVVDALRRANIALSAGEVEEGKRTYIVRTDGELNTIDSVRAVVLRTGQDQVSGRIGRVTVADIADVSIGYAKPTAYMRQFGEPAVGFSITRETGSNVIETMDGIRAAAAELERGAFRDAGLKLRQVYDETVYITSAVSLVTSNIWYGGTLAALVLMLFLRSWRATTVVALAIPVSVIGSFVAMAALGRSLNVISLAGIAFAVGMVVDAAIVVLENIFRLRERGVPIARACFDGARQVWGAVFVSALTTAMVFAPIVTMKQEVGQLFRDIAVAISVSVMLSLLVSITVLPALANRLLGTLRGGGRMAIPGLDHLARGFVDLIIGYTRLMLASRTLSVLAVVTLIASTSITAWALLPKLEYLPNGNRNLINGSLIPPPGYNLQTMTNLAIQFEDRTRAWWAPDGGEDTPPGDIPKLERFFVIATPTRTILGVAALDQARAAELVKPLNAIIGEDPDILGGVNQSSLFGRGLGGTRQIDLDITGPDLEAIYKVAFDAAQKVFEVFPRDEGNSMRPDPSLSLGAPELRVRPDRSALADAGVSALDLGQTIDTFNDGMRVAEVTDGAQRIDLTLMGPMGDITETQGIGFLPVVTQHGQIVPVSSLARVEMTAGPTQIKHKERSRAVSLLINPQDDIPLETALAMTREQIIQPLVDAGLPDGVQLGLSGTADKLNETWNVMQFQLLFAVLIVYLVMAVLLESFIYPLLIMLSVPLAAAGGVGGLAILDSIVTQRLDMLTMLGFVILIGIVVNNAILIVYQTLFHVREEAMAPAAAIVEATSNRIRPIFMSTLTSVVGMLPLVVMPGAGSELYRGLGSVVIGGLTMSAVLTLLIMPPLLSMVTPMLARARGASLEGLAQAAE